MRVRSAILYISLVDRQQVVFVCLQLRLQVSLLLNVVHEVVRFSLTLLLRVIIILHMALEMRLLPGFIWILID